MPSSLVLTTPRSALAVVIPLLLGCADARTSELRVVLDSSQLRDAQEVIALPFDPAALRREEDEEGARADSVRRLRTLADSATHLDRAFQDERAAINAEVIVMRARDRTTREYAEAYRAVARRTESAEQLRATRDRLRTRAGELGRALGIDADRYAAGAVVSWEDVEVAARQSGRSPVSGAVRDTVVLRAAPGRWWLTLGASGDYVIVHAVDVELGEGEQRTVRLAR